MESALCEVTRRDGDSIATADVLTSDRAGLTIGQTGPGASRSFNPALTSDLMF